MFANEKNRALHRFWRVLILLEVLQPGSPADLMDDFVNGRNRGAFDLGLMSVFEMPSPNSGYWSGVAGLRRLLGPEGFAKYRAIQLEHLQETVRALRRGSKILCFQSDAAGLLSQALGELGNTELVWRRMPPTRLMFSMNMRQALCDELFSD
jgi:hypothetical protein